jgi:hypothetical protein
MGSDALGQQAGALDGDAMSLHLYTRPHQPATQITVHVFDEAPKTFRYRRRDVARASCCKARRWMGYLTVQVYYDGWYFWCRPGRGCRR